MKGLLKLKTNNLLIECDVMGREAKMKHMKIALVYTLSFLVGCSSMYPLPVSEKNITSELAKHNNEYGLPIADNPQKAIDNIKDYSDWYFLKSSALRERQYELSDTSLGFGIAGIIAGIAKSPGGAAAGALLASSSEIPNDRYQLAVQSANYEKASDTMHCMYRYLTPHRDSTAVLPTIEFLNDRIYEVRRKLRKSQASITLTSPDLTQLESSLKRVVEQQPFVDAAKAASAIAVDDAKLAAQAASDNQLRAQLENHLNVCVDSF